MRRKGSGRSYPGMPGPGTALSPWGLWGLWWYPSGPTSKVRGTLERTFTPCGPGPCGEGHSGPVLGVARHCLWQRFSWTQDPLSILVTDPVSWHVDTVWRPHSQASPQHELARSGVQIIVDMYWWGTGLRPLPSTEVNMPAGVLSSQRGSCLLMTKE